MFTRFAQPFNIVYSVTYFSLIDNLVPLSSLGSSKGLRNT
jgi:hypothetical protein